MKSKITLLNNLIKDNPKLILVIRKQVVVRKTSCGWENEKKNQFKKKEEKSLIKLINLTKPIKKEWRRDKLGWWKLIKITMSD